MADELKVPGLGNVDKKYVIAGVVVGGGVAVIVFIRARKNAQNAAAQAATATTAALVTDPAGNQCASLDPASGYCPGSAEDSAYQAQYASGGYGGDYGYPASDYGGNSSAGLVTDPAGNQCVTVDPATGYCPGTPQDLAALGGTTVTGGTGTGTGTTPTTNAEWMTDALMVLPGGNSTANQSALSGVLAGMTVTTAQKNVFLEAVGLEGNPPQGYPQPIKTSDTSGQPQSPVGGGTGFAQNQTGTVHSNTTGQSGQVKSSDGGKTWTYTGVKPSANEPKSQTGTVTSATTGRTGKVTTSNAGETWLYAGVPD